ncbi:MOSC domain containing protein [Nitzschia inconspicua]|uniref:MOSC domain containing protein n=1 Tax=Nitzschia inconspicua TaxID=303405 RepID=A0A9K3Q3B7_9STRA|nr:MOSC domain containing protein [Nitzschia inconspicua]
MFLLSVGDKILTCALAMGSSGGRVEGLYRHACKGLSADRLDIVTLQPGETFPDDRIYALMKINDGSIRFDPDHPEWLHKENFLCAFSAPDLMAQFETRYNHDTKRLSLFPRSITDKEYEVALLYSIDMSTPTGRQELADFFTDQSGIPVACVMATDPKNHQFGNTSSGWKQKKDTRTIHIVNAATVRALSKAMNVPLNPTRFRPNIVVDGIPPWSEFDWVKDENLIQIGSAKLEVISRTVRCEGVSIDPLDIDNVVDIPKSLIQHFPQHGPYLGVYAVVQDSGSISLGDNIVTACNTATTVSPLASFSSTREESLKTNSRKRQPTSLKGSLPDRRSLVQTAFSAAAMLGNPFAAFADEESPSTSTPLSIPVEVSPSFPDAKKLFNEGRALESQGNMAAAQRLYAKVTKISPRFIYGWSNLGNTQVAMGDLAGADENYSQAIALCQESLSSVDGGRKCNDLYLLLLNRGSVRLNTNGMAKEALNDLQQANTLRQRPDAIVLQNLARAKELNGMYASADRDYTVSISMTANEVNPFWLRSAMVKLQLGDVKGGFDLLKRVENRFPDAPEVKAASATFLAQQGKQIEAQRKYLEIPDRQRLRYVDDNYLQKVIAWPPAMIDGVTKIAKAVGDKK